MKLLASFGGADIWGTNANDLHVEELLLEFEGGAISSDPFMLFFTDFCSKLLEVLGLMWRFNIDVLVVSVFSSGQFSVKILISK